MEKESPIAKPGMTRDEFVCKWAGKKIEPNVAENIMEMSFDLDKVIQSEMAQPGETVYRKVSVKERLPKIEGHYFTNAGECLFKNSFFKPGVSWWLEEITLPAQQSWPSEEEIRQAAYQYAGTIIKEVDSDHFNAAVDSVVADFTAGINWLKSQQKGE